MTFADLHHGRGALLLPNAWDVASALAFVDAGHPAVGTTSLGVSASHGHPDGARGGRERTRDLVRALRTLPVHVSADIEDGFDGDPARVAAYVDELGVAGINIEDSTSETLIEPVAHASKIAEIKATCGDAVFVNARVDTFWLGQDATIEHTLERARHYVGAGADGVFVPGAFDPETIVALASGFDVPLNVLPQPGLSVAELSELGVRRVSSGSLPYRAALAAAVTAVDCVRAGTSPEAIAYAEVQRLTRSYAP
ncbi:isocitrate lyase/phosphoenolpyruvate mutase family protein [Nocardioidaceae bacterium SCSIO 66511]|nr:isocitrate lyase/phosphoenolpyruvate mutase family protein [Nocardioidaceae bacterium SCSIO 66511]